MMPLEEHEDGSEEGDQADSAEAERMEEVRDRSEEEYGGTEHEKVPRRNQSALQSASVRCTRDRTSLSAAGVSHAWPDEVEPGSTQHAVASW